MTILTTFPTIMVLVIAILLIGAIYLLKKTPKHPFDVDLEEEEKFDEFKEENLIKDAEEITPIEEKLEETTEPENLIDESKKEDVADVECVYIPYKDKQIRIYDLNHINNLILTVGKPQTVLYLIDNNIVESVSEANYVFNKCKEILNIEWDFTTRKYIKVN